MDPSLLYRVWAFPGSPTEPERQGQLHLPSSCLGKVGLG